MVKKSLKFIGKTLLIFVALILLYLVAAFCLSRISYDEETNQKNEISIYIKTNGVHTDIVVPAKNDQMDWSQEIKFSNTKSKKSTYKYLALGWGDKGFYLETPTWGDLKASVAFKAATGLSTTAIHATYYNHITVDSTCKKIDVSKEQYSRLITYISDSFQKDKNNHWINIQTDANYSNSDAFYEANGSYSLFRTCNTWSNNALKHSGQKHCLWTPFDTGIFLNYE